MNASPDALSTLRVDALQIFHRTLADCSIPAAMKRTLRCDGSILHRLRANFRAGDADESGAASAQIDVAQFSQIFVIAIGKAACPMLDSLLAILPANLPLRGVCAAPALPDQPHPHIRYFAAGHPLPNADSFAAARAALELLHKANGDTLVFFLISGGGSALCELPLDPAITLEETRQFHQALIGCGASITEINAIRQQLSAVKGERLALAAAPATQLSLFVSDVPANELAALASGPTLPPQTSGTSVPDLLVRYALLDVFPPAVRRFFEQQSRIMGPTPTLVGDTHGHVERRFFDLLLSSEEVAVAAQRHAAALGYQTALENRCDDWPAGDAARFLLQRLEQLSAATDSLCLISTGEVTVRLSASHGTGGRNQHFALEMARLLRDSGTCTGTVALSAGTDGVDGNSPAAGAIVDSMTFARAAQLGFDPVAALHEHNSWPLFYSLEDAILTGATGNNLRDLRLLLTAR